jgi:hypothetical protein
MQADQFGNQRQADAGAFKTAGLRPADPVKAPRSA